MGQLSASLLAADFGMMRNALELADGAGVDRFHFDFMDGHYVPNLALSPDHIRALRPYSDLPFDVHLELSNPEEIIARLPWEGVSTLILQADTLARPSAAFESVRSRGMRVGFAVNPEQPLAPLRTWLAEIDQFLVLGVQPGFGGQPMHPATIDRVREIKNMAGDLPLEIAVDGGINTTNAAELIAAGADVLVVGTAIFGADEIESAVAALREAATS